jgi:hypothetical protein
MAAHWLVFVIDIRCCFASRPETPEGCPLLWSRQIPHDRQAPGGETHVRQATSRSHGCVWVQRLPAIGVFFQSATDAVGQQVAARGEAASAPPAALSRSIHRRRIVNRRMRCAIGIPRARLGERGTAKFSFAGFPNWGAACRRGVAGAASQAVTAFRNACPAAVSDRDRRLPALS